MKAKWIREYKRPKCQVFECSECGGRVYYVDGKARQCKRDSECNYPHCPYCKADMEREE